MMVEMRVDERECFAALPICNTPYTAGLVLGSLTHKRLERSSATGGTHQRLQDPFPEGAPWRTRPTSHNLLRKKFRENRRVQIT